MDLKGVMWPARANLSKADLSGAILIRANLRKADLSEAILIRANLRKADLSEAILNGAIYDKTTKFSDKLNQQELDKIGMILSEES